jgi:acyl-CoA thioester hydrolase
LASAESDHETHASHAGKHRKVVMMTRNEQHRAVRGTSASQLAPSFSDLPAKTTKKVRFADTDQQSHITSTAFAACCQNARMELLCDPHGVPILRDTQFALARLTLEFRAEVHCPGTVEISTRVERIRRSSVTLVEAVLFVKQRCAVIAKSVVAFVDKTTRRSIFLPRTCVVRAGSAQLGTQRVSCKHLAS